MRYYYWLDEEEEKTMKKTFLKKVERINSIEVHWGLTFASNSLNMQPEEDLRWFWFDTAHWGDMQIVDYWFWFDTILNNGIYRDKEYVIEQTKKLADQLI